MPYRRRPWRRENQGRGSDSPQDELAALQRCRRVLAQALLPGMERGEPLAVLDYTNRTIGAVAQLPAFGLGEEGTPLLRPARSVAMAPLPAVWSRGGRR